MYIINLTILVIIVISLKRKWL